MHQAAQAVRRSYSRATSLEHCGNGFKQNAKIEPKIPFPDVVKIESNVSFERWVLSRCYLPQSGHSRSNVKPREIFNSVAIHIIWRMRAWTHEAHVPDEDIPELRQFIQAVAPQEMANASDSRVLRDFEERARPFISRAKIIFESVRLGNHGAKFVANELLSFASDTSGTIEDRAGRIKLDDGRNCRQYRRYQD